MKSSKTQFILHLWHFRIYSVTNLFAWHGENIQLTRHSTQCDPDFIRFVPRRENCTPYMEPWSYGTKGCPLQNQRALFTLKKACPEKRLYARVIKQVNTHGKQSLTIISIQILARQSRGFPQLSPCGYMYWKIKHIDAVLTVRYTSQHGKRQGCVWIGTVYVYHLNNKPGAYKGTPLSVW